MSPRPLWTWRLGPTRASENSAEYAGLCGPQQSSSVAEGFLQECELQDTSVLSCLWAEGMPSTEGWRAAGVCYRAPSTASARISAQGMWARYPGHRPHGTTGQHLPALGCGGEGKTHWRPGVQAPHMTQLPASQGASNAKFCLSPTCPFPEQFSG